MNHLLALPLALFLVAAPAHGCPTCVDAPTSPETTRHTAYLGVGVRDVTQDNVQDLKLKDARGVVVIAVDHDGPAAKFIHENDVVLEMNHEQIGTGEDVKRVMKAATPGKKMDILLSRDGNVVQVQVVLGDRAQLAKVFVPDLDKLRVQVQGLQNLQPVVAMGDMPDLEDLNLSLNGPLSGAMVETTTPQLAKYFGARDGAGVLVKEVRDNTAAAKAGLRAGDLIVRAAGQATPSRMEWDRRLRENAGKTIPVEVLRDKREQKLNLAVPARTSSELMLPDVEGAVQAADLGSLDQQMQELRVAIDSGTVEQEMAQARVELNNADVQEAIAEATKSVDSETMSKAMAQAQAELNSVDVQKTVDEAMKSVDRDAMTKAMAEAQNAMRQVQEQMGPGMQKQIQENVQKALEQVQGMAMW